jgi:hypothetical protein
VPQMVRALGPWDSCSSFWVAKPRIKEMQAPSNSSGVYCPLK